MLCLMISGRLGGPLDSIANRQVCLILYREQKVVLNEREQFP